MSYWLYRILSYSINHTLFFLLLPSILKKTQSSHSTLGEIYPHPPAGRALSQTALNLLKERQITSEATSFAQISNSFHKYAAVNWDHGKSMFCCSLCMMWIMQDYMLFFLFQWWMAVDLQICTHTLSCCPPICAILHYPWGRDWQKR